MATSPRARLAAFCCAALWMSASPAQAQDDGVTVDPGGPADKEYAIPLDEARKNAAPSGGSSGGDAPSSSGSGGSGSGSGSSRSGSGAPSGTDQPPLFGSGVDESGDDDEAATAASRARSSDREAARDRRAARRRKAARQAARRRAERENGSSGAGVSRPLPGDRSTAADREAVSRLAASTGDSSMSPTLAIGGIGVAVLALGAAVGLVLRRRSAQG